MIDVDESGDLEKQEIVVAVKSNQVANAASYDRANFNLRGLRDLRNCCFRVFGVWWCGIIQRPLHASFPPAESHRLPQKLRRRELAIPAAPAAPRQSSRCPGYRQVRGARHRRVYCPASFCVREIRSFDRAPTTQGKPPSTAASRSAWSSWPTSASAASAPRSGPTPNSRSNF